MQVPEQVSVRVSVTRQCAILLLLFTCTADARRSPTDLNPIPFHSRHQPQGCPSHLHAPIRRFSLTRTAAAGAIMVMLPRVSCHRTSSCSQIEACTAMDLEGGGGGNMQTDPPHTSAVSEWYAALAAQFAPVLLPMIGIPLTLSF